MNLKLIIFNPHEKNNDLYFGVGSTIKLMTGYEPLIPMKVFQFNITQYFTEIRLRNHDIENKIQVYWENIPFSEIEVWGDERTLQYYGNNKTVVIIINSNPVFVPDHRFELIAPEPMESIPTEYGSILLTFPPSLPGRFLLLFKTLIHKLLNFVPST
jgi:hypothetical protein